VKSEVFGVKPWSRLPQPLVVDGEQTHVWLVGLLNNRHAHQAT
jgi:hypothetical protein